MAHTLAANVAGEKGEDAAHTCSRERAAAPVRQRVRSGGVATRSSAEALVHSSIHGQLYTHTCNSHPALMIHTRTAAHHMYDL